MMPILAAPGVMMPGQFGPMRRDFFPPICAFTRIMSMTGMPSVMQTTNSTPASTASKIPSAAPAAGTKITETLQPVSWRASQTVSNTGTLSSNFCPPFPGVTPATTFVPYSMHCRAWKPPALPVMPWTTRRVFLSTRTAMESGTFPFVNQQPIAVGIVKHSHETDRRFDLVHLEIGFGFLQLRNRRVDVIHFERDRGSIARRLPGGVTTYPDSRSADFVLHPHPLHRRQGRLQA